MKRLRKEDLDRLIEEAYAFYMNGQEYPHSRVLSEREKNGWAAAIKFLHGDFEREYLRSVNHDRIDIEQTLNKAIGLLTCAQFVLERCVESKEMPYASMAYQPAKDVAEFIEKQRAGQKT